MITKKETTQLKNHYYKVGNFWKGFSAIKKLSDETKISEEKTKEWLKKQAIWQIYYPAPKKIARPHWIISEVNEIHQADLLFLPHDKIGKKIYKYVLVVIDIASRYKDVEPLTSKNSEEVASAFEKNYSRRLDFPKILIVDPGTEFFGKSNKIDGKT